MGSMRNSKGRSKSGGHKFSVFHMENQCLSWVISCKDEFHGFFNKHLHVSWVQDEFHGFSYQKTSIVHGLPQSAVEEMDVSATEKQIMAVWEKSLHDLPDMAELSGAKGPRAWALTVFMGFSWDSGICVLFCRFLASRFGVRIFSTDT